MGRKYIDKVLFYAILFFITTWLLSSCSVSRRMPATFEVRPMPTTKIIRKIETEKPRYKNYSSKKVSVRFENGENKNIFSGQLKIDRDNCIIVSMKKMSVPLGKGKITPDSIKFVNYFDRYFISEDIGKIKNIIGFPLDYPMLQNLLAGNLAEIIDQKFNGRELLSSIDSQQYRLQSQLTPRVSRVLESGNQNRIERFMKRHDDDEFSTLTIWVDPQYFVVKKMVVANYKTHENITVVFDEHKLIGRSLYPQNFVIEYHSERNKSLIEINLSKSSVNKEKDFSFNIPNSYEKLKMVSVQ